MRILHPARSAVFALALIAAAIPTTALAQQAALTKVEVFPPDINLTTAFLCSREAVRIMRGNTGPDRGRIVNVSSRAALVPSGGSVASLICRASLTSRSASS